MELILLVLVLAALGAVVLVAGRRSKERALSRLAAVIFRKWPSKPKPVISVIAFAPTSMMTSEARRLRCGVSWPIWSARSVSIVIRTIGPRSSVRQPPP